MTIDTLYTYTLCFCRVPPNSPCSVKPPQDNSGWKQHQHVSSPTFCSKDAQQWGWSSLVMALSNCTLKTSKDGDSSPSGVSQNIPQVDCLHGKKFLLSNNVSFLLSSCSGSFCCKVYGSLILSYQYQPLRQWRRLNSSGGCRLILCTCTRLR